MARFSGKVGYAELRKTAPGVTEDVIVERQAFGDVLRASRGLDLGDKVVGDISVTNRISILGDAYANAHIFAMRYVVWQGVRWVVSEVTVERPRLILRLGGVYNGPTAASE